MSVSKYLPPFTRAERGPGAAQRPDRAMREPTVARSEPEVTYADFLGDEAPETDPVGG